MKQLWEWNFISTLLLGANALLEFFNSDWSKGQFKLNSFYYKKNQPDNEKINDCGGNQRKKRLIGSATHNVTHSRKVCN